MNVTIWFNFHDFKYFVASDMPKALDHRFRWILDFLSLLEKFSPNILSKYCSRFLPACPTSEVLWKIKELEKIKIFDWK